MVRRHWQGVATTNVYQVLAIAFTWYITYYLGRACQLQNLLSRSGSSPGACHLLGSQGPKTIVSSRYGKTTRNIIYEWFTISEFTYQRTSRMEHCEGCGNYDGGDLCAGFEVKIVLYILLKNVRNIVMINPVYEGILLY